MRHGREKFGAALSALDGEGQLGSFLWELVRLRPLLALVFGFYRNPRVVRTRCNAIRVGESNDAQQFNKFPWNAFRFDAVPRAIRRDR